MTENKEIISEIRNHLQFLVTVEIFFSTLIHDFSKVMGSTDAISQDRSLVWGIGVGFCILNYILIGPCKEFDKNLLNWIKGSIFLGLAFFITPIIVTILVQHSPVPAYFKLPFTISILGSIWMPIVTFALIITASYLVDFLRIFRLLKSKLNKK